MLEQVTDLAARLEVDPHLTREGMRARLTEAVAKPLAALAAHAVKLDPVAAHLTREAAREVEAHVPVLTADQSARRLAIATRCGFLTPAERTQWVQEAMVEDVVKLEALANEDRAITGLLPETLKRLQARYREVVEGAVPSDRRDALAEQARMLGTVRGTVDATRAAIESAVDRAALRQAGVPVLLRRSDMSEPDKLAYLAAHGLDAFKSLPA